MKPLSSDIEAPRHFIACGMYAFTDELRVAWQTLFDLFLESFDPPLPVDTLLRFETGEQLMRDPQMLIGQTCGYPLMSKLMQTVTPICVPVMDVAGCHGKYYSSLLVVPVSSEIHSLADCYQKIAAINTSDSNSGMNVLRHAVAPLSMGKPYFSEIRKTGSHLQSLTEVAKEKAQVAAIDAVSFSFIQDAWPDLVASVRRIGYTEKTCGLPFVVPQPIEHLFDNEAITSLFNEATQKLPESIRQRLHLIRFEQTDINDYQGVLDLENQAIQAGYPRLF